MQETYTGFAGQVFLCPAGPLQDPCLLSRPRGGRISDEIVVLKFGSSVLENWTDVPSAVQEVYG